MTSALMFRVFALRGTVGLWVLVGTACFLLPGKSNNVVYVTSLVGNSPESGGEMLLVSMETAAVGMC